MTAGTTEDSPVSRLLFAIAFAAAAVPSPAPAQGRADGRVPPGHRPPPGMCRVWIEGVPAGRQPAPTDCETAVRRRPPGSQVIFGSEVHAAGGGRDDRHASKRKHHRHDNGDSDCDSEHHGRLRDRADRDRAQDRDVCVDRDRDGRCDIYKTERYPRTGYPQTLPEMVRVILIDQGRRTTEQARWLNNGASVAHYVDADHDGTPERLTWVDAVGSVLQVWVDADRDGRADAVRLYRGGKLYDVIAG